MKRYLGLLLMLPVLAQAQTPASFVVVLGRDTIAVEHFTRTASRVQGELDARGAIGARLKYTLELSQGLPTILHNAAYRGAADSSLFQSAVLTFKGDSVIADITNTGGSTITQRIQSQAGAYPMINPSFALLEPIVEKAHAQAPAPSTIPLFTVSGGVTFPVNVSWIGSDSVVLTVSGVAIRAQVDQRGNILGAVIPSQNLRVFRAGSASRLNLEKPDYSAPRNANYTAEEVTIVGPAGNLAGTLTLPKPHKARVPVVVTITGSGLEDRDEALPIVKGYRPFRQIAEALAAKGVAVLRYDDRGFGASTGDAAQATSADFAQDVQAALAYLRTRSDVDSRNLFLLGHSEGGMIAPIVAAADPKLRGIVLLAGPGRTGRRILEYQNRYVIDQQKALSPAARDSLYQTALALLDTVHTPWIRYFLDYDPLPTARKVKVPVLILQGANDRQVTADQAPELAAAFRAGGNTDVSMDVIPGVNHLFLADADGNPAGYSSLPDRNVVPSVVALISNWIVKHLR